MWLLIFGFDVTYKGEITLGEAIGIVITLMILVGGGFVAFRRSFADRNLYSLKLGRLARSDVPFGKRNFYEPRARLMVEGPEAQLFLYVVPRSGILLDRCEIAAAQPRRFAFWRWDKEKLGIAYVGYAWDSDWEQHSRLGLMSLARGTKAVQPTRNFDEGTCQLFYNPARDLVAGEELCLRVGLITEKPWDGWIEFRAPTHSRGWTSAHAKISTWINQANRDADRQRTRDAIKQGKEALEAAQEG